MGWGGGVREQASVKCTTHRLPHENLPNNNKQKQERRGRKKCIITVLRFFDSARTSNGTKQKMRQNGTTGGKKITKGCHKHKHCITIFFLALFTRPTQSKPRRAARHMHGWTVAVPSSLGLSHTGERYGRGKKKKTKGWLSRCTGGNNNNKQLCEGKKESQHCVAEKVKCSHHNGHAKKKIPRQEQTGEQRNLTVLFSPHSSCAFNNKKKTERETNFCTLYNYNVFVAWYIYNAMAAKVRRLNKNAARVLYTPVRTRTYEKHVCEGS